MRTILCPRCGASIATYRAFRSMIKPFCPRCGWNLRHAEAAIARTSSPMMFIPIAIAALALLFVFATARTVSPIAMLVPLAVGAILLIPFWSTYSARKQLDAAKSSANPALAMAQPFVDPALQRLQALPRPRRVRFRFPASLLVVLLFLFLLPIGVVYLMAHNPAAARGHVNPSGFLAVPIIFVVLIVAPYFRDKKNAPLLRDGELALARVTYQETVQAGKSSYSRIAYEFRTTSGQLIQDRAKDLTYSVYEDMTIPAFYDPANPSKNVTPCATYLRLDENPF
ncbi:MAG TPA: hypothetical protein VMH20_04420 [Verrucomicrobiae bacterium]|nr:hypothetical protein [Verrucomicrobiae bacterium]